MKLTEKLRKEFLELVSVDVCKHCGRGDMVTHRELAKKVGITPSTMYRFLKNKPISQEAIDTLYEYVYGDGLLDTGRKQLPRKLQD